MSEIAIWTPGDVQTEHLDSVTFHSSAHVVFVVLEILDGVWISLPACGLPGLWKPTGPRIEISKNFKVEERKLQSIQMARVESSAKWSSTHGLLDDT